MSAIGKGDWVRCVDASCDAWGRPVPLINGEVYQVAAVYDGQHIVLQALWTGLCFDLEGVPPRIHPENGEELSWGAFRFEPLGGAGVRAVRRELADA